MRDSLLREEEREGEGSAREQRPRAWTPFGSGVPLGAVVAGCCMNMIAGAPYAFGAYSRDLKLVLALTQPEMAHIGVAFDLGLYLIQPFSGTFFDAMGTRVTGALGVTLLTCGNAVIATTLLMHAKAEGAVAPVRTLCAAFAVVGIGSALTSVTALGTNVKRAHMSGRARVIAVLTSCFGLGALLVVLSLPLIVGSAPSAPRLAGFFGTWAALDACIVGGGALVLSALLGGAAPHTIAHDVPLRRGASIVPPLTARARLLETCTRGDFWLLELTLFCGFGCGLLVINTVASFVNSAGGTHAHARLAAVAVPLCNCGGRLLVGLVSDAAPRVRRGYWMVYSLALMCLAFVVAACAYGPRSEGGGGVALVFALVGASTCAYGGVWGTASAVLAESYPLASFGTNFGVTALTAGAAGLVFNDVCARLFEAATRRQGTAECIGAACFRPAFVMAAACAGVGVLAALAHAPHTRYPEENRPAGAGTSRVTAADDLAGGKASVALAQPPPTRRSVSWALANKTDDVGGGLSASTGGKAAQAPASDQGQAPRPAVPTPTVRDIEAGDMPLL